MRSVVRFTLVLVLALVASAGAANPVVHMPPALKGFTSVVGSLKGDSLVPGVRGDGQLFVREGEPAVIRYEFDEVADGIGRYVLVLASEAVIKLPKGADRDQVAGRLAAAGGDLVVADEVPGAGVLLIRSRAPSLAPGEVLRRFEASAGVKVAAAEPNQVLEFSATQEGVYEPGFEPWAHRNFGPSVEAGAVVDADIDADAAFARLQVWRPVGPVSRYPTVMVIDNGVDITHPALVANLWANPGETAGDGVDNDNNGYRDDVHGWNFASNNRVLIDEGGGHGTHIAGIIAARPLARSVAVKGLAAQSRIVVAKVGSGGTVGTMPVIKALRYALAEEVDIVNMSFGFRSRSPEMDAAIDELARRGSILVAAAGNDGQDVHTTPVFPCLSAWVICVGATGPDDRLTAFSNRGARSEMLGVAGVAIAAPGVAIRSTMPMGRYDDMDGTSMAAPMISGALAAVWSSRPTAKSGEVIQRVIDTADRIVSISDGHVELGRRLNLYQALFGREDTYPELSEYCRTRVTDPDTGQSWLRTQNAPYANSGEPGIDGASFEGAYTLCTTAQVAQIRDEDLDKVFSLRTDINWRDDTSGSWPYSIGGRSNKPFNGVFDGGGFAIVGFDQGNPRFAGLFAALGPRAHVFNLRFRNLNLKATSVAAAITPSLIGGRVYNVQAEGTVTSGSTAGGLVGDIRGGEVAFSGFEGAVEGVVTTGGLVGRLVGRGSLLTTTSFSGSVKSRFQVGGAVGEMARDARMSRVHVYADIIQERDAETMGGLVGVLSCRSSISDSFAEGRITGKKRVGGLVGRLEDSYIERAYSSFLMNGVDTSVGGAVGEKADALFDPINNRYICTETQIKPPPSRLVDVFYDSFRGRPGLGEAKTPAQLQTFATFQAWSRDVWLFNSPFFPALKLMPRSTHPNY